MARQLHLRNGSSALASLAAAGLVPTALVAATGGADLDLMDWWRVSWYEPGAPALALAAALLAVALRPTGGRWARGAFLLGAFQLAVTAAVSWSGGVQLEWISVRDAMRPAAIGAALLALGALGGLAWRPRPARRLVLTLGAGAALTGAVVAMDRSHLETRIAGEPARDAAAEATDRPDVVLLVADTLRADALGLYGAEPSPSPTLDALGASSLVFEQVSAQAPWTLPSMLSLFTSRHPSTLDPEGFAAEDQRLAAGVPTLAETLAKAGYHTAGFQKNPFLGGDSGLAAPFDVYEMVGGDSAELESGAQLVGAALRWARAFRRARESGDPRPYLLYVHFMDPHIDYLPPADYVPEQARNYRGPIDGSARSVHRLLRRPAGPRPEDIRQMQRLYRAEVRYLDDQIARLVEGLRREGLFGPETVVAFTADHGEQFGEHGGFEHGDLYVENVHVPLLLRAPSLTPRRIPEDVRLLDVAPTILDLAGAAPLPGQEGRSLLPLARSQRPPAVPSITEHGDAARVARWPWALIRRPNGSVELYDRRADPREQRDLADEAPEVVARLAAELREHEARRPAGPAATAPREIDAATREQLEALGYLD